MSRRHPPPDVALDVRETSHTSAGMRAYTRALRRLLPRAAPDLRLAAFGRGDNFDPAEQIGIPLALLRMRPRLAHFPSPFVPRVVPVPYVVTVHDVIDLEFPQYAKKKVGPYWRHIVGPVLRGARAIVTDDEATVDLLARFVRVDPARVRVVPLGVDAPEPLPPPVVRARPYLFYAGNHRPHKDLPTLVRAWAALPPALPADLLLTGPEEDGLRALGARNGAGELVFLGEPGDEDVWRLLRGAAAYVHPALREGFGLPLLEAMRAGTPVVAAADRVARVFAPHVYGFVAGDVTTLTRALGQVLAVPAAAAARAQRARAQTLHFDWDRTVRATAQVYREVLGAR